MTTAEAAQLMGRVLGLIDLADDDNFFDVGGNSFLALKIVDEIRIRWGVKIGLVDVIRAPTPEALANKANAAVGGDPAE